MQVIGDNNDLLQATMEKWRNVPLLEHFREYFVKEWVESDFDKWQLFRTSPGLAQTNSPIESHNNQIKISFTKPIKHHLKRSLLVFQELVSYESHNLKEFTMTGRVKQMYSDLAFGFVKASSL